MANPATAWDSVPDYDKWGPDTSWGCVEWEQWYYALKDHFNEDTAKYIWSYAWDKQTIGASALDCRSFNSEFRSFLRKNDLMDAAGGNILGAGYDIFKGLESITTGTVKMAKYILPTIIIAATLAALYLLYNTAKTGKLPFGVKFTK